MPRRYKMDANGEMRPTFNGKFPEEFTEQDTLAFMADTDMLLDKNVSEDTFAAIHAAGYDYQDGVVIPQTEKQERNTPKVTYQEVMEEVKQTMMNDFMKCRIKCEAKYHETDTQLGYGSVIIDQQIKITGIRLMKSQKNPGEIFLSMPRQKGSQGEYYPVCILEPRWQKEIMSSMLIDIMMQKNPLSCRIEQVKVKKCVEPPLCAFADVTVNGITIYGVKLLYLNNKYICKFPQTSTQDSNKDIVYPMKPELRGEITEAVVKVYKNLEVKKTNTTMKL